MKGMVTEKRNFLNKILGLALLFRLFKTREPFFLPISLLFINFFWWLSYSFEAPSSILSLYSHWPIVIAGCFHRLITFFEWFLRVFAPFGCFGICAVMYGWLRYRHSILSLFPFLLIISILFFRSCRIFHYSYTFISLFSWCGRPLPLYRVELIFN